MKTFVPLQEFLEKEVTPEEFIEMLDEVEHQCSMHMAQNHERADADITGGLHYLHRFRKTLEKCK